MARTRVLHLAIGTIALVLILGFFDTSVAQLGGRPADDWMAMMERPDRVAGLQVDAIIGRLDLKPGQVVADIGAGPGVFSLPLARAVGPSGRVYAEEVAQAFIERINEKIKEQQITNVQPVLGTFDDPRLPFDVDLAFFHDALHHVENRAGFLKTVARSLKPDGRFAVIEYDGRNGPHKAAPELQITKEQLDAWMAAIGFVPVRRIDDLFSDPRWFVIYARQPR